MVNLMSDNTPRARDRFMSSAAHTRSFMPDEPTAQGTDDFLALLDRMGPRVTPPPSPALGGPVPALSPAADPTRDPRVPAMMPAAPPAGLPPFAPPPPPVAPSAGAARRAEERTEARTPPSVTGGRTFKPDEPTTAKIEEWQRILRRMRELGVGGSA
jgi:hypothetical protein